ncbi:MAG: thiamine pyrophosphate-binding protein, partial [Planctomyces sp.]
MTVSIVENAVQTINGAQILIRMLVRHGTKYIYAYPGGCSMPLHQALREQRDDIRTILPRHEQGGCFAAQGIARSTGEVGVCMATSGPGATNLVTAIADAKLDSIPLIAITGQVPQTVIGTDAFQETPMVEVCRAITKHHYMITNVRDIARIVKEAYYIASTGRPGPVLIDVPKDVQLAEIPLEDVDFDPAMRLPGYRPEVPKAPPEKISQVIAAIRRSRRPVLYVGGGCIQSGASE